MADLSGFDARTVDPNEGFPVLPAGEYDVAIVNTELKRTTKNDGSYLKLDMQVLNGPYQNQHLFDNLNIDNPNAKAVQIAKGSLSAICRAVGVLTPKDSAELHNKPLRVKVVIEKSDEYGDQNRVKGYKSRSGTAPTPAASPAGTPAPAGAAGSGKPW